jgi:hypothetical protein
MEPPKRINLNDLILLEREMQKEKEKNWNANVSPENIRKKMYVGNDCSLNRDESKQLSNDRLCVCMYEIYVCMCIY